jgi:uncharacterized protein YjbI with pentapeptide repeats
METDNFSAAAVATLVEPASKSQYRLTVLVKALLDLHAGEVATMVVDDIFPQPDLPLGGSDAEGAPVSLQYSSDFAPFKPRADVVLVGTAHRPSGDEFGAFRVGLRVGGLSKQLLVTGDRAFSRGILTNSISQPMQVTSLPIIYENAFGGPGYEQNPIGKGIKGDALPNIEYPGQQMKSPYDKPRPAGFGPIAADWEPRKRKIGSYRRDYLTEHWPGFPADFDWSYFNAAPDDQQVEGYLRGDEEIVLENLHSERSLYTTRLPGSRMVCVRKDHGGACSLVPLHLDTLWINADEQKCVLVWRGQTEIATPECFEIERIGILAEPLTNPWKEAGEYRQQIDDLIKERDGELEEEPPSEAAQDKPPETTTPENEGDAADDQVLQALAAEIAAFRKQRQFPEEDPEAAQKPLQLTTQGAAEQARILAELEKRDQEMEEEERAKKWTRERVIKAVTEKSSLEKAELSGLDLSKCNFAGVDFRTASLSHVDFSGADLANANFCGCEMEGATFDGARMEGVLAEDGQFMGASLRQAVLKSAQLTRADLSGACLDKADLTSTEASAALFADASLRGAKLLKAKLQAANLSGANFHQAVLTEASLAEANCISATFTAANLARVDLTGADFTGATLNQAQFQGAKAVGADFTEADLTGATFRGGDCSGMWLSSAKADNADFSDAKCVDMQLDGTSAKKANFKGANITAIRGGENAKLTGASFALAHGLEPVFESCNVDGADFSFAVIAGANFINASAKSTNFTAAELKEARFDYAQCQQAMFDRANLFEACFAGSDLDRADVRGANLYGAEFLDARFNGLEAQGANLKMSKLQKWQKR